jgi:hypothetical protein
MALWDFPWNNPDPEEPKKYQELSHGKIYHSG